MDSKFIEWTLNATYVGGYAKNYDTQLEPEAQRTLVQHENDIPALVHLRNILHHQHRLLPTNGCSEKTAQTGSA